MQMKIVVGVDGSEHSHRAVEWCAKYAGALAAEVVVVHAIEMLAYSSPIPNSFPVPQISQVDRDELQAHITAVWCATLAQANVPFQVVVMDGDPALVIMDVVQNKQADLVVTGRRGRGGFAELVLGSTSHTLTHHLKCPLVIVP